jgi:hypothetical protein
LGTTLHEPSVKVPLFVFVFVCLFVDSGKAVNQSNQYQILNEMSVPPPPPPANGGLGGSTAADIAAAVYCHHQG